jgi:hypothetical protein
MVTTMGGKSAPRHHFDVFLITISVSSDTFAGSNVAGGVGDAMEMILKLLPN